MKRIWNSILGKDQKDVPAVLPAVKQTTPTTVVEACVDEDRIDQFTETIRSMFPGAEITKVEVLQPNLGAAAESWEKIPEDRPAEDYVKKEVRDVLGGARTISPQMPEGMGPEELYRLGKKSKELRLRLKKVQDEFVKEIENDIKHAELTYVLYDAYGALIADWGCSDDTINKTTMGIPDAMMCSVELIQYNFSEKQKTMYDRLGRWIH